MGTETSFDRIYQVLFFTRRNSADTELYFRVRGHYGETWRFVRTFPIGVASETLKEHAKHYYENDGSRLLLGVRGYPTR